MSYNESIVEDAPLEWFSELGYAVGNGSEIAHGESVIVCNSFGEVLVILRSNLYWSP